MKPLLKFHCTFQVVPDPLQAFDMTQTQKYDAIIMPQGISAPFSASTLFDIITSADGTAPPFIFLIGRDEMPKRIKGCVSKYVRYTQAGNIPLHELSAALTSCVMRDAAMAEAYPLAVATIAVSAEVTPLVPRPEYQAQLTMKVPGRSSKAVPVRPAVPAPAATRPLQPQCPSPGPRARMRTTKRQRDVISSTSSSDDGEPAPMPCPEASSGVPEEQHWAAMQWQASQQFQQRYSPQPTRSAPNSAAALPVSPERSGPERARSPPLSALLNRRYAQRTTSDLGLGLNSRGVTEVDPELVRILDGVAVSPRSQQARNASAADVSSLRNVFND